MNASGSRISERSRSAVTIGTFDGVHVGHQLLVATTRGLADEGALRDVVVTFDRHPFATIRPEATPKLLTTQEQKIELLRALGADDVIVLAFDTERSRQEPESFIEDFLVAALRVAIVVVGAGFRFGHRARGDAQMLEKMGDKLGFSVVTLNLVGDDTGGVVSSSQIRELIAHGELDDAERLLGRPYEVRGELVVEDNALRVRVSHELLLPPPGRYEIDLVQGSGIAEAIATVPPSRADEDLDVDLRAPDGFSTGFGRAGLRFRRRPDASPLTEISDR